MRKLLILSLTVLLLLTALTACGTKNPELTEAYLVGRWEADKAYLSEYVDYLADVAESAGEPITESEREYWTEMYNLSLTFTADGSGTYQNAAGKSISIKWKMENGSVLFWGSDESEDKAIRMTFSNGKLCYTVPEELRRALEAEYGVSFELEYVSIFNKVR